MAHRSPPCAIVGRGCRLTRIRAVGGPGRNQDGYRAHGHPSDHAPVVRLAGKLAFVVAVKKDNDKVGSLKELAGCTVCGLAPPKLATLTMQSTFENPARQPA